MSDKKNAAYHGADFEAMYFRALAKLAEIQSHHKPKNGENERGPYVMCNYDHTDWPCMTQGILAGSDSTALERRDQAVAMRAWDEGFGAGVRAVNHVESGSVEGFKRASTNPYRAPSAPSDASTEGGDHA